ncbi:NAD(P)-dependent dehydrogenase, short-chain alcohol dehydrogenase family [Cnuella takakiae]|uniref:NAD(P)-dependent dehydrogenase, short-chain alcohol dehydrogenase family n=1 Tax=Cnuella takakiae TaxID=1302690 RepID=A0A1M5HTE2_9BACT|nr:SDR family oxidoreductase [Cnuella takakiae]OLY95664.1 sugar dehydrogenase [Cnuella takakiae]SHG19118.1 NAD(P)-dependent dehydrogenase, short-chain alcohol dehydrogenase family [Cnuella takakiae]
MRFQNKVCIVTGGASGIGKAICQQMAAEGGKVVIIDISDSGQQAANEIDPTGNEALFIKTDISIYQQVEDAVKKTVDKWGRVDVLVNNAAIMTFKPILELSEGEWDKVMAVNMKSVFMFCKLCLPYMNGAAIVNISSVHYHETTANVIPYASSKGAMEAFTRGMSIEYSSDKVRINCVAPGAVDTPMLWSNPNVASGVEKITGKIGKPEDIAAAVCFIASAEATYINGASLHVDGGRLNIL